MRDTTKPIDARAALRHDAGSTLSAPNSNAVDAASSPAPDAATSGHVERDASAAATSTPRSDAAAPPSDGSATPNAQPDGAATQQPELDAASPTADGAAPASDSAAPALDAGSRCSSNCTLQERAEDTLQALLASGGATGYSIAVWRDGQVVYAEGFGVKNAAGDPVTRDTLFQIGSDTKKLTAITALQRVAEGQFELESSVGSQLEDLDLQAAPGALQQITIHDLLSMRSGLFNYTPWIHSPSDSQLAAVAYGTFAENEISLLPPGVAWTYGNANYSLLGLLVETAEQRPWPSILSQDVFEPLGMLHSYARLQDMLDHEQDIASGFGYASAGDPFAQEQPSLGEPDWVQPEQQLDNAFLRPAGLVWSTASDQARLLGFLIDGNEEVLPNALREALLTPQVPVYNHAETAAYGYGVSIAPGFIDSSGVFRPTPLVAHGGETLNMTAMSLLLPELGAAVVLLANGAGSDLLLPAFDVLQAAVSTRLPAAGTAPVDPPPREDLTPYLGYYSDAQYGPADISLQGETLQLSMPLLTEFGATVEPALQPVSLDLFIATIDGVAYPLSFYPDENGTPTYAVSGSDGVVLVRQD